MSDAREERKCSRGTGRCVHMCVWIPPSLPPFCLVCKLLLHFPAMKVEEIKSSHHHHVSWVLVFTECDKLQRRKAIVYAVVFFSRYPPRCFVVVIFASPW